MSEQQPHDTKESEWRGLSDESNLGIAHDPRTLGEYALRKLEVEAVTEATLQATKSDAEKSAACNNQEIATIPTNENSKGLGKKVRKMTSTFIEKLKEAEKRRQKRRWSKPRHYREGLGIPEFARFPTIDGRMTSPTREMIGNVDSFTNSMATPPAPFEEAIVGKAITRYRKGELQIRLTANEIATHGYPPSISRSSTRTNYFRVSVAPATSYKFQQGLIHRATPSR